MDKDNWVHHEPSDKFVHAYSPVEEKNQAIALPWRNPLYDCDGRRFFITEWNSDLPADGRVIITAKMAVVLPTGDEDKKCLFLANALKAVECIPESPIECTDEEENGSTA